MYSGSPTAWLRGQKREKKTLLLVVRAEERVLRRLQSLPLPTRKPPADRGSAIPRKGRADARSGAVPVSGANEKACQGRRRVHPAISNRVVARAPAPRRRAVADQKIAD